ncbi:MAG: ABC transporter ATP-binding protein [Candidatus Pacebacteria bacterium]|nr:ABC transporter ATP-binding protein [Candidatus Paceibacterota bacterium]
MSDYSLNKTDIAKEKEKGVLVTAFKRLIPLMKEEGNSVIFALAAIFVSSAATLVVPIIIGHIVDVYLQGKNFHGVLMFSILLTAVYIVGLISSYIQVKVMGGVGRRLLFNLRNKIFEKLQALPVAFFNQNKEGDIISRINNDTDKLNQFFSQAFMQFISNIVLIVGTGIFLLAINIHLGGVALIPAVIVLVVTQFLTPWVKRTSLKSLRTLGSMSGEISESINNFKVIVAFNRLDYFRDKFRESNEVNYKASISAGIASNVFTPLYTLAGILGQIGVLAYGIYLISVGHFTVGLLISFLLYVNNFYNPLRQLASVWPSLQLALAGLDRISEILTLESNIKILSPEEVNVPIISSSTSTILEFKNVYFRYGEGKEILKNINFKLEKGKTYAFVGPTGGGKTTTASLMARLYDPAQGEIYLESKDIRLYSGEERAKKIGFILQEPFLFTGTVYENIIYGNKEHAGFSHEELTEVLEKANLTKLLDRFSEGLDTRIHPGGDAISLGQKQLIAFIRAVLRNPDILILDEATANIDTVTEQLLEEILRKLPVNTTRVIIAHRLNTIENADEIFFVNGGEVTLAGDMQHAVDMLLHGKRQS